MARASTLRDRTRGRHLLEKSQMKLTNRFNLPEPFVKALGLDEYERGDADFTTTELIKPVRINAYTKTHWEEMEEDVSDRVWRFAGQTKHIVLQQIGMADPDRYLVEERFSATTPGGKKVSGKIDLFDFKDGTLYDWKETSVWKFILGDMTEWEQQANVNLFLMRMAQMEVRALKNVALLKDWKARLARTTKRKDYPQCAIHVCDLPMWSMGQQQEFILERIKVQEEGRDNPPVCTKKERWQRDHVFALHKKGRKSALRLFDNSDQAQAALEQSKTSANPGESFFIEERQAEPVRCLDFCPVKEWCDFGREAEEKWRKNDE